MRTSLTILHATRPVSNRHPWCVLLLSSSIAVGCAKSAPEPVIGTSQYMMTHEPIESEAPKKAPAKPRVRVPRDAVETAALPYHGLRERDREALDPNELFNELATADAVCIGERHPDPHDHFAQLTILRELSARARASGREIALGLEMVENPKQKSLDAYASHQTEESEFLEDSEWESRWGFDFSLYRPMFELARSQGVALFGLNAPRELVRKVARSGLDSLSERERKAVPELDLTNSEHRERFDDSMRDHPKGHGKLDDLYVAQVIWDETMAAAAATWATARAPARQIVIFAGRGHCVHPAIPDRMRRRGAERAVSVVPLRDSAAGELDSEISGFDYALVLEEP